VPAGGVAHAAARLRGDALEVWVNGEPLLTRAHAPEENKPATASSDGETPAPERDYEDVPLSPDQCALFRPGRNVVAVRSRNTAGAQFVDIGFTYEPAAPAGRRNGNGSAVNGAGETPPTAHPPTESSAAMERDREGVLQTTG
jgi:hypothetical protein